MKEICYAYEEGRPILSNVNMEFETGKMYAILVAVRFRQDNAVVIDRRAGYPQKGEILFEGENISQCGLACHRRNHVALIFQSYNLIDYMTPVENVALTAKTGCSCTAPAAWVDGRRSKAQCDETVRRQQQRSGNRPRPGF